jgi:hypothetical protein
MQNAKQLDWIVHPAKGSTAIMAAKKSKKKSIEINLLVVRKGYGADQLHLRQTERQVREFLGKPESITRKFKGQYFLNYFRNGIQVDIGRPGGWVRHIYFFRESVRKYSGARMATTDGLKVGDPRTKVLRLLGKPHKSGKPFILHWGEYVGEWWWYKEGISFTFGRDHRADAISILPRMRLIGVLKSKS